MCLIVFGGIESNCFEGLGFLGDGGVSENSKKKAKIVHDENK